MYIYYTLLHLLHYLLHLLQLVSIDTKSCLFLPIVCRPIPSMIIIVLIHTT